jgi:hypothetical protein
LSRFVLGLKAEQTIDIQKAIYGIFMNFHHSIDFEKNTGAHRTWEMGVEEAASDPDEPFRLSEPTSVVQRLPSVDADGAAHAGCHKAAV